MTDKRTPWTDAEVARLVALVAAGKQRRALCDALPGRSYHAISNKMHTLGVRVSAGIDGAPPFDQRRRAKLGFALGSLHTDLDPAVQQSLADEAYSTSKTVVEVINDRLKAGA